MKKACGDDRSFPFEIEVVVDLSIRIALTCVPHRENMKLAVPDFIVEDSPRQSVASQG